MHIASFSDITRTEARLKADVDAARRLWQKSLIPAVAFVLLSLYGCGGAFEDNGTHLAYALEKGTSEPRASNASALVVHYNTLDNLRTLTTLGSRHLSQQGRRRTSAVAIWLSLARPPAEPATTTALSLSRGDFTSRRISAARPRSFCTRTEIRFVS
jgi:hypothetical protein